MTGIDALHRDLLAEINNLISARLGRLTYYKIEHSVGSLPTITTSRACHISNQRGLKEEMPLGCHVCGAFPEIKEIPAMQPEYHAICPNRCCGSMDTSRSGAISRWNKFVSQGGVKPLDE